MTLGRAMRHSKCQAARSRSGSRGEITRAAGMISCNQLIPRVRCARASTCRVRSTSGQIEEGAASRRGEGKE